MSTLQDNMFLVQGSVDAVATYENIQINNLNPLACCTGKHRIATVYISGLATWKFKHINVYNISAIFDSITFTAGHFF